MIHLCVQRPLGQCLLQAVEEAVRIERRLRIGPGQKLVEDGVGDLELFASRHVGAPSLPSCPLTHEIPDRATNRSRRPRLSWRKSPPVVVARFLRAALAKCATETAAG